MFSFDLSEVNQSEGCEMRSAPLDKSKDKCWPGHKDSEVKDFILYTIEDIKTWNEAQENSRIK